MLIIALISLLKKISLPQKEADNKENCIKKSYENKLMAKAVTDILEIPKSTMVTITADNNFLNIICNSDKNLEYKIKYKDIIEFKCDFIKEEGDNFYGKYKVCCITEQKEYNWKNIRLKFNYDNKTISSLLSCGSTVEDRMYNENSSDNENDIFKFVNSKISTQN